MKSAIRRLAASNKTPVPIAGRAFRRGLSFDLGGGRASRETYMRTYSRSGTVYSIVSLLQQSSASVRWHLYYKQAGSRPRYAKHGDAGTDERRENTTHAAIKLWNAPNEFHSGFEFREGSNQHLELAGETFWVLNREAATFPTAIWYIRPDRMEPVPSPDDYLVGWIYNGPNGEQVPLNLDEVILEKLPDPLDPFRGHGPVASILDNIQQQDYATQYQRNLFLNGAMPGGIIQAPQGVSMTDREWDEFTDRWRESHQGVARAGRVGLLENGLTWVNDAPTNKDMEYGDLRLANRDEIREAWRMHKAMLGTSDDVNRANAETAEEIFAHWQEVPRLERRRDTLNTKLLPMFGPNDAGKFEFDFDNPVPEDREQANAELVAKSSAAQTLIAAGFDADAVLEVVGLPEMPWKAPVIQQPEEPDDAERVNPGRTVEARERVTLLNKNAAAKVFKQVSRDYPPEAMAWMHHAQWSGPVEVPLAHIQPMMQWLDRADPHHVQDFVQQRAEGKKLKPLLLVKTPGSDNLLLVDGHHRYLAEKQLDEDPRCFIGVTDADHGPWETMHDHQLDGPRDAANLLRRILSDGYVPVGGNQ